MEFDKDLTARQEARTLCKAAAQAQHILADMSQEQLDAIVEAIAKAFAKEASVLADMAVRETGFGNVEDKITKNLFASERVAAAVRGMKTVGLLREVPEKKLWEIGVPVGVADERIGVRAGIGFVHRKFQFPHMPPKTCIFK